jgi:DNA-binding beta-propeller fold protein YncE
VYKKLSVSLKTLSIAAFCSVLLLFGCATTPAEFQIDRYGDPSQPPILWPDGAVKPRYRYAGQLTGEDNFVKKSGNGGFKSVIQWITGAITGKRSPILLQRPQMGDVDEVLKRVYVSDVSRAAVFVFDEIAGKLHIWEMAGEQERFKSPIGVAAGSDGEVFVSDSELGYIVRLDKSGKPIGTIGKGQLIRPTGLARDGENGLLYVADSHAHDIKVFNDKGELHNTISKRGDYEGALNFPTHLAFADGKLYVSDTLNARVQVFSGSGSFEGTFGRRGLYVGDFTLPKGVAVDGEGNVYVIESYYDYLLVFDNKGQFLLPIGGTGSGTGSFYLPSGVWTDSRDRIYVSDMFNRRVVVFQYLGEG